MEKKAWGYWTKERLLQLARDLPDEQLIGQRVAERFGSAPIQAAFVYFGGWRPLVEAVGRKYPGRYRWRTNRYRQTPELFQTEVKGVPPEKLGSTYDFCKEQGLEKPVFKKRHLCTRCEVESILKTQKYCASCAEIATADSLARRQKRWLEKKLGELIAQILSEADYEQAQQPMLINNTRAEWVKVSKKLVELTTHQTKGLEGQDFVLCLSDKKTIPVGSPALIVSNYNHRGGIGVFCSIRCQRAYSVARMRLYKRE